MCHPAETIWTGDFKAIRNLATLRVAINHLRKLRAVQPHFESLVRVNIPTDLLRGSLFIEVQDCLF